MKKPITAVVLLAPVALFLFIRTHDSDQEDLANVMNEGVLNLTEENSVLIMNGDSPESFANVCQYAQSSKQNAASCKESGRKLHTEYPSHTDSELKSIAARVIKVFSISSDKMLAEATKKGGIHKDDPSYDQRRRRVTHSKAHGCAYGEFEVSQDIPAEARVGAFANPGSRYRVWARLANGTSFVKPDHEGDARSLSFKLIGVPGRKLLIGGADHQTIDFVMNNSPVFFIKSPRDFGLFFEGVLSAWSKTLFFAKFFVLGGRQDEKRAAQRLTSGLPDNLLKERYSSGIAIRWGLRAVKYALTPVACPGFEGRSVDLSLISRNEPDFYRAILEKQLNTDRVPACWDLGIQEQVDAWKMPIEDTTIEWSESESPFVTVGRLRLDPQPIDQLEKLAFCDSLSFSVWRTTEELRPLGDLSKLRHFTYYLSRQTRNKVNGSREINSVTDSEPTGDEFRN
jgi:hypothetical protein